MLVSMTEFPLTTIELAGRTCYKSEEAITVNSAVPFIRTLIKSGHESVLEHASVTVRWICDRGVSHELVRHRIGVAYSQESTRYCNYKGGVTFIVPSWMEWRDNENMTVDERGCYCGWFGLPLAELTWFKQMLSAETAYIGLLEKGWTPQQARSVLPNSLKTEVVITANMREWRHILKLRTSPKAHPDMQLIAKKTLELFREQDFGVLFEDIGQL
jgi:thymidylate synthase (FAD)